MAEWCANLVRLAFLLRPTSGWTQQQKMWMGYQVPILLKTHKGFLDHAVTTASEAEACAKKRKTLDPVELLPASGTKLAPAEAFSPHTANRPQLLTTAELEEERKKIADQFFAAQSEKGKNRAKAEGREAFLQRALVPLEACPPAVLAVESGVISVAKSASAVPGWQSELDVFAAAGQTS